MARLAAKAMQNPMFRKVVATKTYQCKPLRRSEISKKFNQQELCLRQTVQINDWITNDGQMQTVTLIEQDHTYNWVNSDKLLGIDGYIGVKTGITEAAGPCLASCYEKNGHCYIIILLQAKTMEHRWDEAQRLVDWAIQRKTLMTSNSNTTRYDGFGMAKLDARQH